MHGRRRRRYDPDVSDPETVVTICECGHDIDLHQLDVLAVDDFNEDGRAILKWKFTCRGMYAINENLAGCACIDIQPVG